RSDAALADRFRLALGLAYESAGDRAKAAASLESVEPGESFVAAQEALVRLYADPSDAARRYVALTRLVALEPTEARQRLLGEAETAARKSATETTAAVWAVRDAQAKPAPDFSLVALDGKTISLASLRGKVVVLNFWFPACAPCRAELPLMQKLYEQYRPKG